MTCVDRFDYILSHRQSESQGRNLPVDENRAVVNAPRVAISYAWGETWAAVLMRLRFSALSELHNFNP